MKKTLLLQIAVLLATFAVYAVNYLAASGGINATTPAEISNKFPTVFTPAGYAFTIWGIIYLAMLWFSVYQLMPEQKSNVYLQKVRPLYLVVSALNIGWIFVWHYEYILLSGAIMVLLFISLWRINFELKDADGSKDLWLSRIPFSIYFGWITVASIANLMIAATYLGLNLGTLANSLLGVLLIAAATAVGVILRFRLDTTFYPLAIAWGITAIGIKQSGDTVVVFAAAFGMMTLIFFGLWGYIKDR